MKRFFISATLVMLLFGCSSNNNIDSAYKIGIDPLFEKEDFGKMTSNVNGFVDDMLLQISKDENVSFKKIDTNYDVLFENLNNKKLDGIISSTNKYLFNKDLYNFSNVFLNTGPMLVVSKKSKIKKLSHLYGKIVAITQNDELILLAKQKFPKVIVRDFSSDARSLNAVIDNRADAAIIFSIPAGSYLNETYDNQFRILKYLSDDGLKLITLKDNEYLIRVFNRGVKNLEKMKKKFNLL
jgi:ABC-type amino acid transport substrate-binding protein